MHKRAMGASRTAAFTLVELLAVIVILSILAAFLVVNLKGAADAMDVQVTKVTGQKIVAAIQEYVDDRGDVPRSTFTSEQGTPPNDQNIGIECLYVALCAENAPGFGDFEEHLSNSDGDALAKKFTGFETPTLFEFCDQWQNPYAYFHWKDYGREDRYVGIDSLTNERVESIARSRTNPETKRAYEPRGFQLISAGPDGEFGGDDDVSINFKVKKE